MHIHTIRICTTGIGIETAGLWPEDHPSHKLYQGTGRLSAMHDLCSFANSLSGARIIPVMPELTLRSSRLVHKFYGIQLHRPAGGRERRSRHDDRQVLLQGTGIVLRAWVDDIHGYGFVLHSPVWNTIDWPTFVISLGAMIAIFRFKARMVPVLASCSVLGVIYYLITGTI